MKKKMIIQQPSDAASGLPYLPVEISGKTYKLCLDPNSIADAEEDFNRQGLDVNLLRCFGRLTFASTRDLFAASLRAYHPEIEYKQALSLLDLPHALVVGATFAAEITKNLPKDLH